MYNMVVENINGYPKKHEKKIDSSVRQIRVEIRMQCVIRGAATIGRHRSLFCFFPPKVV